MMSSDLRRWLALSLAAAALHAPSALAGAGDADIAYEAVAVEPVDTLMASADTNAPDPLAEPSAAPRDNDSVVGVERMVGQITTARRRSEPLQAAPVAVTAFGTLDLAADDARRLDDLTGLAPNVIIENTEGSANSGNITIRGVGEIDANPAVDPAVGLYIDGVYTPRAQGLLTALHDVERVEVIRGPQGTLFGKNTIGGAISVTTKKPDFEFGGGAEVRVGNFNQFGTRLALNVPLIPERAAARFSLATNYDDGFERNVARGDDVANDRLLAGRAQLLLLPANDVDVLLGLDYARENRRPQVGKCMAVKPIPANSPLLGLLGAQLASDLTSTCASDEGRSRFKGASDVGFLQDDLSTAVYSAQIGWEISESLMLRSITAFRDQRQDLSFDNDNSVLAIGQTPNSGGDFSARTLTQEFQLTGRTASDRLNYVLGLFAFHEAVDDTRAISATLFTPELIKRQLPTAGVFPIVDERRDVNNRSFAAFGQFSYGLTDRLTFGAGLRRTVERKRLRARNFALTPSLQGPAGATILDNERSSRFSDYSPNASLSYQFTPKALGYLSYATGFRSGGFNGRQTFLNRDTGEVDPEDLTTYETGLKTTFADDRLLVNGALFYSIYEDIQRVVVGAGPVPVGVTQNAAEARLGGAELEITALPAPGLRLESNLSAFRSRYTDFDAINPATGQSNKDARLPNTPNYLLSFGATYQTSLAALGVVTAQARYTHFGAQGNDVPDARVLSQGKYGLLSGRLALLLSDGQTELAVFGTNLLNREYFDDGLDVTNLVGVARRDNGEPRRYGVELKRSF